MESPLRPAIVAHCDWSTHTGKRWMAVAAREEKGWRIGMPEPVGDTATLFDRLAQRGGDHSSLLIGFDFPIGLPWRYGQMTGFASFREALAGFGSADWPDWFRPAERPEEISVHRPFYPMRPGGTKLAHLTRALDLTDSNLHRHCERATGSRPAAARLFWTMGASQVGKAAISGWQDILQPGLDRVGLWPFEGSLQELFARRQIIVAETYPADVYERLGILRIPRWSKRQQAGRIRVSGALLRWLARYNASFTLDLVALIENGFGSLPAGEDQFDALVGLFGMLDVIDGRTGDGAPADPEIRQWEGWILGQGGEKSGP